MSRLNQKENSMDDKKTSTLRRINPLFWWPRAEKSAKKPVAMPIPEEETILSDPEEVDQIFDNLHRLLLRQIRLPYGHDPESLKLWPSWATEKGRIYPGRSYFFIKPHGKKGFLFERSGAGWVISKSEKIVGRDLFLRSYEAWDIASIAITPSKKLRVLSSRLGSTTIGLKLYENRLIDQISAEVLDLPFSE